MKGIISYMLMAFVILTSLPAFAQNKLTEATITYTITINTENANPQIADMLDGATSTVYLKGNSSRSDLVSSLGMQSTIIDGKTGDVAILKDYGEQKFMINMTSAEWMESNKKYADIEFTYEEEYKTIAGYKAQKAVGKLADGTEFTVYFTRDLVPVNKDFQYINKNLPGLALEYEAVFGKSIVTYSVSNINFNPVPLSRFVLPKSGYRVMTYQESLQNKRN